jgi:pimeloyl-ACP methyl ester carboxylesterase
MTQSPSDDGRRPLESETSVLVPVAGGVELRCLVRRGGDGAPLLLVHGLASNARLWDEVAAITAGAGHDSVAVDQRGHGRSTKTDRGYDFATLAADLAAVIDQTLRSPVAVIGQSWGGNVVLELAALRPDLVSGVALVDGGFLRLADDFASWEVAAEALAPPSFAGVTFEELERMAEGRLHGFPSSAVRAQLANFEATEEGAVRARLRRDHHMMILRKLWEHDADVIGAAVRAPILVLAVDQDSKSKRQRVDAFAAATNAEVMWLEGHHDIHAQQPQVVAAALLDFVRVLP